MNIKILCDNPYVRQQVNIAKNFLFFLDLDNKIDHLSEKSASVDQ